MEAPPFAITWMEIASTPGGAALWKGAGVRNVGSEWLSVEFGIRVVVAPRTRQRR
jgi:hypothetical protein